MKVRKNGFFVIRSFMIDDLGLRGNELLVYAIIHGFSQDENQYFTGSLNYLTAWTGGTDKKTIIRALNCLIEKGLLEKEEVINNNIKYCRYKSVKTLAKKDAPLLKNNEESNSTVQQNSKINIKEELDLSGGEIPLGSGKISMSSGETPLEVVEKRDWGSGEIPPNNIDIIYKNNIYKSINGADVLGEEKESKKNIKENFSEEELEEILFSTETNNLDNKTQENSKQINSKKYFRNNVLDYINSLSISEKYRAKLIEFYNYRRKIDKRIRTENSINFIINQDFVNEEHAILCIDFAMGNEYVGVKADYINYEKTRNKHFSNLSRKEIYAQEDSKGFRKLIFN